MLLRVLEDMDAPIAERICDALEKRGRAERAPGDDDDAREAPAIDLCRERIDDAGAGNDPLEPWELELDRSPPVTGNPYAAGI